MDRSARLVVPTRNVHFLRHQYVTDKSVVCIIEEIAVCLFPSLSSTSSSTSTPTHRFPSLHRMSIPPTLLTICQRLSSCQKSTLISKEMDYLPIPDYVDATISMMSNDYQKRGNFKRTYIDLRTYVGVNASRLSRKIGISSGEGLKVAKSFFFRFVWYDGWRI